MDFSQILVPEQAQQRQQQHSEQQALAMQYLGMYANQQNQMQNGYAPAGNDTRPMLASTSSSHSNGNVNGNGNSSYDNSQASIDPSGARSESPEQHVGSGQNSNKTRKTRRRQQTSCSECHRRKQKCNKETPCDRCIKRGTASACRVMPAGENDAQSGEEDESPPADIRKRKRKQETAPTPQVPDDLALRVQQLENIIRSTQALSTTTAASTQLPSTISVPPTTMQLDNNYQPTSISPSKSVERHNSTSSTSNAKQDRQSPFAKHPQSAVEEAAVAALGELSKATVEEGETRLYSGPGSVTEFMRGSGFGLLSSGRARARDLRTYAGLQDLHNMHNAPARITKLADAVKEHKQLLPPAALCHYLLDQYYTNSIWADRHRGFPRGCFQLSYDALWEDPKDMDHSKNAQDARDKEFHQLACPSSLAFLSMLFSIFACSLSLSPIPSPETHQLAASMYAHARSAFAASEMREQPTYATIFALLSQGAWVKLAGCPSTGFTWIGQAARFGQSMGLHREPGPKWELSGFEKEIRRRLWWSLYTSDKGHSLAYGRPYLLCERHCDTKYPANCYEEDLTKDGPTNIRPLTECTDATASLIEIEVSRVITEIIDRAFSCRVPTYTTVLELDKMITDIEMEHIPNSFKNPSVADMVNKPYLKPQYISFQSRQCWLRALIHRPYLLHKLPERGEPDHYAGSRAAAVMLSQRMLTLNKELVQNTPMYMQAYFGFAFNLFEPSVILATAILQDPLSSQATAMDIYIQDALRLLEAMSSVNAVAKEGVESLILMRSRYLQAMEEAKAALSPSASTSGSGRRSDSQNGQSVTGGLSPLTSLSSSSNTTSPATTNTPPSAHPNNQNLSLPHDHQQHRALEGAPTPNTLFNSFFSQYQPPLPSLASGHLNTQAAGEGQSGVNTYGNDVDMQNFNFDNFFNLNANALAADNADGNAAWLTAPIEVGMDSWPQGMEILQQETSREDWQKMLGM